MKELVRRLEKKGWIREEIEKVCVILKRAQINKSKGIRVFEHFAYWLVLAIILIGNGIISLSLVPLILVFDDFNLYITIIVAGLVFGVLFDSLLSDASLTNHHYILNMIMLPVIAAVIFVLITIITNYLGLILELNVPMHNPIMVGIIYAIAIILPHSIRRAAA
ncbi:hypothetical protein D6745_05110 [Candidatus Woesearchaeota archaeon]|nr:MAG: hypothetical protein D6745_05110 [Candidatus Woesearchaeota archaeon]